MAMGGTLWIGVGQRRQRRGTRSCKELMRCLDMVVCFVQTGVGLLVAEKTFLTPCFKQGEQLRNFRPMCSMVVLKGVYGSFYEYIMT
jgi:hypothetical protein